MNSIPTNQDPVFRILPDIIERFFGLALLTVIELPAIKTSFFSEHKLSKVLIYEDYVNGT